MGVGARTGDVAARERARDAGLELVHVGSRLAQAVVVEQTLGVEHTAEEQREVAVCYLDDVRDLVDSLAAVERVLVYKAVLDALREGAAHAEGLGGAREDRGVDNGGLSAGGRDGQVVRKDGDGDT